MSSIGEIRRMEWRRGGLLVFACSVCIATAAVPAASFSLFVLPLESEFGWSRSAITTGFTLQTFLLAVLAPFVGKLIAKVGIRRVGLAGVFVLPLLFAALSLLQGHIFQYWLNWAVLGCAISVSGALVWTMAVAREFDRARGLAIALVLVGSTVAGSIVFPPLISFVMEEVGWRMAYTAVGGVLFIVCVPVAIVWFRLPSRPRPEMDGVTSDPATGMSLSDAVRTFVFWRFILAILIGTMGIFSMYIHLVPIQVWRGFTPAAAVTAISALGLASLTMKFVAGYLLDVTHVSRLASILMLAGIVPALFLQFATPAYWWWPLLIGGTLGIATSAEIDFIAYLSARLFGLKYFSVIYGVAFGTFQMALGLGPMVIAAIYDRTQAYGFALNTAIVMIAGSSLLFASLKLPPRPSQAVMTS